MSEKHDQLDKSRAAPPVVEAVPEQRLTPLRRRIGQERLRDPVATEYAVIKRAGGSHWTARAPKRNRIDTFDLAERVARSEKITVAQARRIGLGTLATLACDEKEAGGTRGAASKALLDYAAAVGQAGPHPGHPLHVEQRFSQRQHRQT